MSDLDAIINGMDYDREGVMSGERKESTPAKDELFHSLYISGTTREDNDGPTGEMRRLKAEHLQVRGTDLINMDDCYVQFFYKRMILSKEYAGANPKFKKYTECFSWRDYDANGIMHGTSGNECGKNSDARKCNPYCQTCKAQVILCGFMCEANGAPMKDTKGNLIHFFIRARGIRIGNVMQYIFDCQELPVPFISQDESKSDFEKSYSNLFRRVVKISTEAVTGTGANGIPWSHLVYKLTPVCENDSATTMKLLQYGHTMVEKIETKFNQTKMVKDWWEKYNNTAPTQAATGGIIHDHGYGNPNPNTPDSQFNQAPPVNSAPVAANSFTPPVQSTVADPMKVPSNNAQQAPASSPAPLPSSQQPPSAFDDIPF